MNEWIYATPAQEVYLRRLRQEAARYQCAPYYINNARRMLKSEAIKAIDDFKSSIAAAKARKEQP